MIARTLAQLATSQTWIPQVTCVGLVLFFGIFSVLLLWTSRRKSQDLYRALSDLPLAPDHALSSQTEVQS